MTATTTRLHITPFTPEILSAIVSREARALASNISYHSLETFPENNYGYIDLPPMEAEKIKKKLNGAILKGKKVKIEEARPKKRKHTEEKTEQQSQEESAEPRSQDRKKRKKEKNAVSGHELSPDRKVKRGWTETKPEQIKKKKDKLKSASKPQATSKYTEKKELLFKTKIPQNRKSPKGKDGKKGKGSGDGTTVHEFEKSTTVPTFLRSETSGGHKAIAYEDGKGWVDGDGSLVEVEGKRVSKKRQAAQHGVESEIAQGQLAEKRHAKAKVPIVTDSGSESSAESSSPGDTDESDKDEHASQPTAVSALNADADDTSTSGDSEPTAASVASSTTNSDSAEEVSAESESTPPKTAIHPLEALFKKPSKPASRNSSNSQDAVKPSLEVQTSFSFFEASNDHDTLPPMPMTPFSSQDARTREIRSAAPTPDTAHPSRMNSIFDGENSDGDLSEMDDDQDKDKHISTTARPSSGPQLQPPQTDFEKQFWEKRGENNRAWKARRRAVLKEKRQRENRARRPKNW